MTAKYTKSPKGRRPKSYRAHLLAGNPGNRDVYVPPENSKTVGPCPTGEPPTVQRIWRRAREEWGAMLTRDDRRVLLDYCQVEAEAQVAWDWIHAEPPQGGRMVVTKAGDVMESPWARRWRNLRAERLKILSALGATPTTRQRVPGGITIPAAKAKTPRAVEQQNEELRQAKAAADLLTH